MLYFISLLNDSRTHDSICLWWTKQHVLTFLKLSVVAYSDLMRFLSCLLFPLVPVYTITACCFINNLTNLWLTLTVVDLMLFGWWKSKIMERNSKRSKSHSVLFMSLTGDFSETRNKVPRRNISNSFFPRSASLKVTLEFCYSLEYVGMEDWEG